LAGACDTWLLEPPLQHRELFRRLRRIAADPSRMSRIGIALTCRRECHRAQAWLEYGINMREEMHE